MLNSMILPFLQAAQCSPFWNRTIYFLVCASGHRTRSDQVSDLSPSASWLLLLLVSLWEPCGHTFLWTAPQIDGEKTSAKMWQNILHIGTRHCFQYLCFLFPAIGWKRHFPIALFWFYACLVPLIKSQEQRQTVFSVPSPPCKSLTPGVIIYYLNPTYIECLL